MLPPALPPSSLSILVFSSSCLARKSCRLPSRLTNESLASSLFFSRLASSGIKFSGLVSPPGSTMGLLRYAGGAEPEQGTSSYALSYLVLVDLSSASLAATRAISSGAKSLTAGDSARASRALSPVAKVTSEASSRTRQQ